MKLRRLFFTFLLVLAAFQFCFSQEKSKAVLFDEFGKITCEELLARLDAFFIDLTNNPNSQGYAVIYGKPNSLFEKLGYEQHIIGWMNFRQFDKSRLTVVRGKDVGNLKLNFGKFLPVLKSRHFLMKNGVMFFPI